MPEELAKSFKGFHSIRIATMDASDKAFVHVSKMGFKTIARRSMEGGKNRAVRSEVIVNGGVKLEFLSPMMPLTDNCEDFNLRESELKELTRLSRFLEKHGEGVIDVAFDVSECEPLYNWAVTHGAKSISPPTVYEDQYGKVIIAAVSTYGDISHTFIQSGKYYGPYLPGYDIVVSERNPANEQFGRVHFVSVDHCVGNQNWGQMAGVCDYYRKVFGFHKFISDDDYNVVTDYSALETTVMASDNDVIKMPITMPAKGKKMSQVEEYIKYNNGPGVQHIALCTDNIFEAVAHMRERGVEFISVPQEYYIDLKRRIAEYKGPAMKEDLAEIERLNILVDFNKDGYLFQLFVKDHFASRPTLFYEIIQREGANGFGGGNFRSLFESIEREQAKRGNLN
ncbi:Glyoxalase/Bleomycin resistance protein/Dihydroxybiphenyl dioxygenase [Lipomyces oligophaga]|uniref:Glyoxalase/Bleomycin resistance protein/Dihydroxybiphenyl dioxygenase n=1 Tax=Lipomyces oligophaga TaxID=45792 RepID=UPI0034D015ED